MTQPVEFELQQLHEYVRLTARMAMQTFMFACTINAAVAAFLLQMQTEKKPTVIPIFLAICDVLYGLALVALVPLYYCPANLQMQRIVGQDAEVPMPICWWIVATLFAGIITMLIGVAWLMFWPECWDRKVEAAKGHLSSD